MRIAVISDIHSNIYALEATLKCIEKKNIDKIICTGDLVGYHTSPNEVVKLIQEKKILTVMGNHDFDIATKHSKNILGLEGKELEKAEIFNYALKVTSFESKEFLKNLPKEIVLEIEGKTIKFVHGSPNSLTEYLKENSESADKVMEELKEDILVCGHSHLAYFKKYGEKLLVNAGSIGKPKKGIPDSEYVILDIKNKNVELTIENVKYCVDDIIRDIENSVLPNELGQLLKFGNIIN
ncbi:MAG: metallophosphoesterase family protein [Fusobacteriaceae bacterium]